MQASRILDISAHPRIGELPPALAIDYIEIKAGFVFIFKPILIESAKLSWIEMIWGWTQKAWSWLNGHSV